MELNLRVKAVPLSNLGISTTSLNVATEVLFSHTVKVLNCVENMCLFSCKGVWLHIENEFALEEEVS